MAKFLIEDPATGMFLRRFGGVGGPHFWTSDPEAAWSNADPREAAFLASDRGYGEGVGLPFKIKRLVISTRDVPIEPYTEDEYRSRTVRNGPREAFSVPCPQCRAKKDQPCVVHEGLGKGYQEGAVHGLRRRYFLDREIAKAAKTGRPNPYVGLKP
ncbi:hypothetical protein PAPPERLAPAPP_01890 [Brevundimonas phage vB_BpoS-Papperlapapp]|nr:hypothetical protein PAPPERLAPAPP_01890 [Brevundimonas phage vB_BpoS-Papperlapapp]